MKNYILLSLNTNVDTTQWHYGKSMLELMGNLDVRLEPQFISDNGDRVNIPYEKVAACEKHWTAKGQLQGQQGGWTDFPLQFAMKRKNAIKYTGTVDHTERVGPKYELMAGCVSFQFQPNKKMNWLELFCQYCDLFEPKFAMLHLFTEPELERCIAISPEGSFRRGPVSRTLSRSGIPNMAWATYFGGEYAEEVDELKLTSQGFLVKKIGEGYLVVMTENIFDIENDFIQFSETRDLAKKQFKDGMFSIK